MLVLESLFFEKGSEWFFCMPHGSCLSCSVCCGKDTWNNNLHRILLSPLSYVSSLECTPARKVNSHSHQAFSFEYI